MKTMILILAFFFSFSAHAQWSTNPSVNTPICTAPQFQRGAGCISDGAGGAIFAWLDARSDSMCTRCDSTYIYFQRVNAAGIPQWESNGIRIANIHLPTFSFFRSRQNEEVKLLSDGDGGAICAFVKGRLDTTGIIAGDLYAQRVDASGSIRWQDGGVLLSGGENGQEPTGMTSDGAGGAIVVFEDGRYSASTGWMVSVQRINADGMVLWGAQGTPVNTTLMASGGAGIPDLVTDGAGGAIVVWPDGRSFNNNNNVDIFAQRVNSAGTPLWISNGVPVCTAPGFQALPRVVSDSAGGAIVSWLDSTKNVMAQRIDGFGVAQWTLNGIAVYLHSFANYTPTITSDGTGGAIIAWTDLRTFTGYHIYAQRLNQSGTLQWAAGGVPICLNPNWQEVSNIISDGAGGAIISWADHPPVSGTTAYNIYAQRVNLAGVPQWTTNGVVITNAPDIQEQNFLTNVGTGAAILVWEDLRAGGSPNSHIYAQRVSANGTLGGPTGVDETALPLKFVLEQNYPNPFNPTTNIGFKVHGSGLVSLKVFDILGREVATLVNENLSAGSYNVTFKAEGLSSGVYLYRLMSDGESLSRKLLLTK